MDKHELAHRLARRSRQSRGTTADKLDALIHKLWKESTDPKPQDKDEESSAISGSPVENQ